MLWPRHRTPHLAGKNIGVASDDDGLAFNSPVTTHSPASSRPAPSSVAVAGRPRRPCHHALHVEIDRGKAKHGLGSVDRASCDLCALLGVSMTPSGDRSSRQPVHGPIDMASHAHTFLMNRCSASFELASLLVPLES